MPHLLDRPADGIPPVAATPAAFQRAADQLAAGSGPFAIDTERASAFRYDDRAFLLQIRRAGSGTVLLDPEGGRDALTTALAPVLNNQGWIIHAAPSDLPCLAWLGLYPSAIFDTELAARMAGFDHPNLGAMLEALFDVELEKAYGDADWSARPIPARQLAYAALDVELLLELGQELADILAEDGKLGWANAEFAHIVDEHRSITAPPEPDWTDLRGIGSLRTPTQLAAARALWTHRDRQARARDIAPGKILSNKALLEVARSLPRSEEALRRTRGFPRRRAGASQAWFTVLETALRADPSTFPSPDRSVAPVPGKSTWSRDYPELWEVYQDIRADIDALADDLVMQPETIIKTSAVRGAVWAALGEPRFSSDLAGTLTRAEDLPALLRDDDCRDWQIQIVTPILERALFR